MGLVILPFFNKWIIKEENSYILVGAYDSRDDALQDGLSIAKKNKTDLILFNNNDEIEESYSFK